MRLLTVSLMALIITGCASTKDCIPFYDIPDELLQPTEIVGVPNQAAYQRANTANKEAMLFNVIIRQTELVVADNQRKANLREYLTEKANIDYSKVQ